MAPVCKHHHHLIHEGGWTMTIDAHRTISLHRPDGTPWRTQTWRPPDGEHPLQSLDTLTRRRRQGPPGEANDSDTADAAQAAESTRANEAA